MSLILKSPDNEAVRIRILAICRRCKTYHKIVTVPDLFGREAFRWEHKHRSCMLENPKWVEFLSTERFIPRNFDDRVFLRANRAPWWLNWRSNADIKIEYDADTAFNLNLTGLASSASFTAGMESDSVSNTTDKFLDYRIYGSFISGTTPTAPAEARLYYVAAINDAPTWPDVFDGTASAETVTNTNILEKIPLGWSGTSSTSSNVTYPIIGALTLAQAYGVCPSLFVMFFSHAHTAALKTDAANDDSIFYQGIYATVV